MLLLSGNDFLFQESLVATYSASSPSTISLYVPPSVGTLSKVLPGKVIPPSLLHAPTPLQVVHQATPTLRHSRGLHKAVYEVGGIGVFIYLFGKVCHSLACLPVYTFFIPYIYLLIFHCSS